MNYSDKLYLTGLSLFAVSIPLLLSNEPISTVGIILAISSMIIDYTSIAIDIKSIIQHRKRKVA